MGDDCLADHLGRLGVFAGGERQALAALKTGERATSGELLVVKSGWLYCSMLLEDGRRQITRLYLPGDLLGIDTLVFAEAPNAICALTDAEVILIGKARFGRLLSEQLRLAALLSAATQVDRVMPTDRLASLGRSSARGPVAVDRRPDATSGPKCKG